MMDYVDEAFFLKILNDSVNYKFKKEYIKEGFVVFKEKKKENYYIQAYGHSILIDNLDDFNKFLKNPKVYLPNPKQYTVQSIFFEKNPYNEAFPKSTKQCVDKLKAITGIQLPEIHTLTERDLFPIDLFLNNQGRNLVKREKIFIDLVAIFGELMIQQYKPNCHWSMRLSDDGMTWEPDIQYNNKNLAIGVRLYEQLADIDVNNPLVNTAVSIDYIINMTLNNDSNSLDY